MKRLIAVLVLIASFSLSFAQEVTEPPSPTVRIGAYNIQIFGKTKVDRPNTLTVLAEIATTYDVLAIEEVGSNGSSASDETCNAVMDAFVGRINQIAGTGAYAYVRGNQYAIVYRIADFSVVSSGLYAGTETFTYTPLIAYLKSTTGSLDFAMIVIHTSTSKAKVEIPALKTAMSEVANFYAEPDVVCLGDYNADGNYYDEGAGPDLAGFDPPAFITVIPDSADTTVAVSSNTYDRMELSSSMATDYNLSWGVVEPRTIYDLSGCEGTAKTAGTESTLSDHYPVWAEFYLNRDTD